jgi:hypothetical protein
MTVALIVFGVLFSGLVVLGLVAVIDLTASELASPDAEQASAEHQHPTQVRYLATPDALSGPMQQPRLFAAASEAVAQRVVETPTRAERRRGWGSVRAPKSCRSTSRPPQCAPGRRRRSSRLSRHCDG